MRPLDAKDWERYPQNLHLAASDLEASRINTRISQLSKDLFVANPQSTFEYTAIGTPYESKSSSSTCLSVLN